MISGGGGGAWGALAIIEGGTGRERAAGHGYDSSRSSILALPQGI